MKINRNKNKYKWKQIQTNINANKIRTFTHNSIRDLKFHSWFNLRFKLSPIIRFEIQTFTHHSIWDSNFHPSFDSKFRTIRFELLPIIQFKIWTWKHDKRLEWKFVIYRSLVCVQTYTHVYAYASSFTSFGLHSGRLNHPTMFLAADGGFDEAR